MSNSKPPAGARDAVTDGEKFADWLAREMPSGTIIGNPYWWAPRIIRALEALTTQPAATGAGEPLESQVDRLANFIIQNIPGEPSQSQGAIDTAIRLLNPVAAMSDALSGQEAMLAWAVNQWHDQVANRPLVNVHRRSLDDVWRQVIRHCGADDVVLIGPRHDQLLAESQESKS